MAVRTVRRGNPGMLYGLIFFVFLTLVAVALDVYFYGELDKHRKIAENANDEIGKYITAEERGKPEFKVLVAEGATKKPPRSAINNLKVENESLKSMLSKNPKATRDQIEAELKAVGMPEGDVVTVFVADTKTKSDANAKQVMELQQKLAQADERVSALGTQFENLQKERTAKVAALTQQVAGLASDYQASQTAKEAQVAAINSKLAEASAKAADELRQKDGDLKAMQTQLAKLQVRLKQEIAKNAPQRPAVPDLSREVDGRIINVDPNRTLVYIDLGRLDHLVLGTTFEVFDPTRGVEVSDDGKELKRGKASIEVVSLSDHTAACRIVRGSYAQGVLVNDVIANLIYDKNRSFKFFLFGDFDLDGDGVASLTERETMLMLIRDWGGQVAKMEDRQKSLASLMERGGSEGSMVPLDTDFVVIGKEPELPKAPAAGETRPEVIRESIQAKQRWDAYVKVKNEAGTLSIPVINQNRFLALIGYYKH